jgi:tetratricopeptide (TPR) repeat protein
MHDIKHLEEQWRKYNQKKRRPFYLITLLLIMLGAGSYFFIQNKIALPKISQNKGLVPSQSVGSEDKRKSVLIVNKTIDQIERNIHGETTDIHPVPVVEDIPVLDDLELAEKSTIPVIKSRPKRKVHLKIIETSAASAYNDVAKRFYQTHDPDDSLFLAKAYFKKHDYKKAEYWALQTNKVNRDIEESWLIFAQSKLKQGRKNEAIHILTTYVKRSNSTNAKQLLKKLKND